VVLKALIIFKSILALQGWVGFPALRRPGSHLRAMSKTYIIGITGGSGSGKTSFLQKLCEHFAPGHLTVITQDNYYRPKNEQKVDEGGVHNFDLPEAIDHSALLADVQRLLSGEVVVRPEYMYNNEEADCRDVIMQPAPILLLEGLFVFHDPNLQNLIDLKIYLHAKENLKVIRRIRRDQVERNYALEDVLYRYENHIIPTFERHIRPYREEADLVINNNRHFENGLRVVVGFLERWLRENRGIRPGG